MKKIPYGGQYLDKSDLISVKNSLSQSIITQGAKVKEFEKNFTICKIQICLSLQ